jgi:hypothetical protein
MFVCEEDSRNFGGRDGIKSVAASYPLDDKSGRLIKSRGDLQFPVAKDPTVVSAKFRPSASARRLVGLIMSASIRSRSTVPWVAQTKSRSAHRLSEDVGTVSRVFPGRVMHEAAR